MASATHHWRFFRLGGFDQVRLETAEDLRHLDQLDQKLWTALSCPVRGLEFDPHTLSLLDVSADGRVRVAEVLAAVRWCTTVLKNMDNFIAGTPYLDLGTIDDAHPEGRALLASAGHLLKYLQKSSTTRVSFEDLAGIEELLASSVLNGDGVIIPASTDNPDLKALIEEIMACAGTVMDRSGQPGISTEQVELFFDEATAYTTWRNEALVNAASILPFGDNTQAAATAFFALRPKIEDYFVRCGLAAYDHKAAEALNPSAATYEALAECDVSSAVGLEKLPLAQIRADQPLPLASGLNPAWSAQVAALRELALTPLFGVTEELSLVQWRQVQEAFVAYEAWCEAKAGALVEAVDHQRLLSILAGPLRLELEALIAQDESFREETDGFEHVSRLTYFTRDLMVLLNNFVTFSDFYSQKRPAIFQAGTLYLDGRACELCVRVDNIEAHQALATLSRVYLTYCECQRRNHEEKLIIAAAFTGGDADNLMVGRNGVFYDRSGQDWDATIVKIIEHPISVRQAFWSPYKRFARMIGAQIEKFASAKNDALDAGAGSSMENLGTSAEAGKAPAPFDVGKFAGIFAAIGLAIGAIGTALATILGKFLALPLWQMPLTIGGIVLFISGPSTLIAYLKLRQRTLGPILDAGGWAVNSKASINIPFGSTLTKLAVLPPGSERSLRDPFAEKKTPWKRWAVLLVLFVALGMAWDKGYIQALTRSIISTVQSARVAAMTNATQETPAILNTDEEPAQSGGPPSPSEKIVPE